jgi:hypothetical protein
MNKIIFAAALLAVLILTLAIGVTATMQQANARIETRESCAHKDSVRCTTHNLEQGVENAIFGIIDGLVEPSK